MKYSPAARLRPVLIEYPRQRPAYDFTAVALAVAMGVAIGAELVLVALRTDLRAAHRITWETRSAAVRAASP